MADRTMPLLLAGVLLCASGTSAQAGGAARARTKPDVTMTVEAMPGTSSKALEALKRNLKGPLAAIKRCYRELVKQSPDAAGTLQVELELREGERPAVRVPGATGALTPMQACVDLAFSKLDESAVPRPVRARVSFVLSTR